MSDQKKVQKQVINKSSEWLKEVNSIFSRIGTEGQFSLKLSSGRNLLFEWEKVAPKSERLNGIIRDLCWVFCESYAVMETKFARKHIEAVPTQMFLKPLEQLFKEGADKTNWELVEDSLFSNLQDFFAYEDFAKYSEEDDLQLFVAVRDLSTGIEIGAIQFLITKEFDFGNVRIGFIGVRRVFEGLGMESLLMSVIFKLIPAERIFLHTRVTNEDFIKMCENCGFVKFEADEPMQYWQDLEYLADKCDVLQKTAENFDK